MLVDELETKMLESYSTFFEDGSCFDKVLIRQNACAQWI